MATKGNLWANKDNYFYSLRLDWERIDVDVFNYTSTISWSLTYINGGITNDARQTLPWKVNIDGSIHNGTYDIIDVTAPAATKVIASGTTIVKHNAAGAKEMALSFEVEVQALPVTMNIATISASSKAILDDIVFPADILTVPYSFTDEDNPIITYVNRVGADITKLELSLSLDGNTNDIVREIPINGSSYTLELTGDERDFLRSNTQCSTQREVYFTLFATYYGNTIGRTTPSIYEVINCAPTIDVTVRDISERTLNLTGDSNTFIRYASTLAYDMGAGALKGATLANGIVLSEDNYHYQSGNTSGTIEEIGKDKLRFIVVDSRNLEVEQIITFPLIPYQKVTCNLEVGKLTAEGDLTIKISGKCFNGSFGIKNNTLEFEYGITKDGGDIEWVIFEGTPYFNGDAYSLTHTISGLDYKSSYKIVANVIDELTQAFSSTQAVSSSLTVFDWGKSDFNFNVPVYFNDTDIPLSGLADYVIEDGTAALGDGRWHYRKWYSGYAELYGELSIADIICNVTLGGWYRTAVLSSPTFPFEVEDARVTVSYESAGYGALVWETTNTTSMQPPDFYLIRPTSSSGLTGKIIYNVAGKWK